MIKIISRVLLTFSVAVLLNYVGYAEDEIPMGEEQVNWIDSDKVKLQGLDKVTGRVFEATVRKGQKVVFGTLEMSIEKALHAPPEEPTDSAVFIKIFENRPGEEKAQVFKGWMFASEPALNPFDHSVYDVWLKETIVPQEAPPTPEPAQPDSAAEGQKHEEVEEEIND